MATTTEPVRKMLVDGDWYETGETLDVTSPFDGSLVAQVAYGGGDDARRAIDAAAQAMRTPVPAHERAVVLDRLAAIVRDRRDEFAETISREAGKPISTARVEAERAVQTILFSAVEARSLGGEVIGMDAHPAGAGHAGLVHAPADRRRGRDLAVQLPAQPGRAQGRAGVRRRLRGRAQAGRGRRRSRRCSWPRRSRMPASPPAG